MCKNIFIEIYLYRNNKEIHIADCHMITTSTTSFSYSFYNPFFFSKHLGLLGSLWGRLTQNFIPDISGSLSIRSSDLPALGCCKFALLNTGRAVLRGASGDLLQSRNMPFHPHFVM